ncbi:CHAT domain-containing protein [uncultured Thiodictyon sp.]|uniref:CHAT domain-containing protein n=1 Tax=uncultured Thiodictyon sp. TaxID=1846217 RepID=UPI0025D3D784|nr:CHAT domain-containing protein [uncultured Thiodictyon sp.]
MQDLGRRLGDLLGEIPTLLAELSRARSQGRRLVHLRLSLSASELGMVPFETAVSPAGFPGTGSPLFLQSNTPVAITREVRRGRMLPLDWNRKPQILLAFASPPGLPQVPADAHLRALRDAINPWLKVKGDPTQRLVETKKHLAVLPDASLQDIRAACAKRQYTHVHILAHGAPMPFAGDKRFGIVLCRQEDRTQPDCVDGESLALALTGKDATGTTGEGPTLVSLSTCDSGNINSVLTPGGSIAHELHAAGVPWVIASQFPLWMRASSIVTSELFKSLLDGEDPRWVLYGLRQKLRTDCPSTHDWASIVAYATLPADFEQQVAAFRERQMRGKVDVIMDRLDDRTLFSRKVEAGRNDAESLSRLDLNFEDVLSHWFGAASCDDGDRLGAAAAVRLSLTAAWKKRLGIAYSVLEAASETNERRALDFYRQSRDLYRRAFETEPTLLWRAVQFLSLNALPVLRDDNARAPFGIDAREWWSIAIRLVEVQRQSLEGALRTFALTDLVELNLLGSHYAPKRNRSEAKRQVDDCLEDILNFQQVDRTPANALAYQLSRYRCFWKDSEWDKLVEYALQTLRPGFSLADAQDDNENKD